jgi:uncharacterized Zn finger protein (UPF0148 family)
MNAKKGVSESDPKAAGLKRTGDMMLSGWTMLADHCPVCQFPLMGKANDMRCPGCDMPVMFDIECVPSPPLATLTPTRAETILSADLDDDYYDDDDVDVPTSLEEMKKEYDARNKKTVDISAKLGEKMLAGWVLLGDVCTNVGCRSTPLMKGKSSPDMLCVSCDNWYVFRDGRLERRDLQETVGPAVTGRDITSRESVHSTTFDVSSAPFLKPQEKDDTTDASEKISRKLLLGWTMLDRVCEGACRGGVPLMKDRDGKVGLDATDVRN